MLMERLPASVETVYFANPLLSRDDILYAIADDLHVELPRERPSAVLRTLQEHLIARYAQGKQVVLLVDEAHAMPADTLEEIRLLSNLESGRHKLLQIVLFGQPELDQVLDRPEMRQLKDRITHHFTLEPLVRADVAAYIDFRMRAAGYRGPEVFSADAVRRIARASGGLTRRINILADKALLAAFAGSRHRVDAEEVRAALRDARLAGNQRWLPWAGAAAAATIAVATLVWLRPLPAPGTSGTPAPAAPSAPGTRVPPTAQAAVTASVPAPLPAESATPQPGVPTATIAATPGNRPEAGTPSDRSIQIHLDQASRWLPTVADEHWFVQLLTSDADDALAVERFLVQAAAQLDARQLRVYQAQVGSRRRLGVIYGDYASRSEAEAAIRELPASLGALGAYPRQVRWLR
jgi:type II secretory pathway predicted ATPase ExeA